MGIMNTIEVYENPTPITTRYLRQNEWVVNYYNSDNVWRKTRIISMNDVDDSGRLLFVVFELLYGTITKTLTARVFNITSPHIAGKFSPEVYSRHNFDSQDELEILLENETLINIFKKNE
jgi:hypothetical protein